MWNRAWLWNILLFYNLGKRRSQFYCFQIDQYCFWASALVLCLCLTAWFLWDKLNFRRPVFWCRQSKTLFVFTSGFQSFQLTCFKVHGLAQGATINQLESKIEGVNTFRKIMFIFPSHTSLLRQVYLPLGSLQLLFFKKI